MSYPPVLRPLAILAGVALVGLALGYVTRRPGDAQPSGKSSAQSRPRAPEPEPKPEIPPNPQRLPTGYRYRINVDLALMGASNAADWYALGCPHETLKPGDTIEIQSKRDDGAVMWYHVNAWRADGEVIGAGYIRDDCIVDGTLTRITAR